MKENEKKEENGGKIKGKKGFTVFLVVTFLLFTALAFWVAFLGFC